MPAKAERSPLLGVGQNSDPSGSGSTAIETNKCNTQHDAASSRGALARLHQCLSIPRRPLDHPSGYLIAIAAMLTQTAVFGSGYALSTFISVIEKDASVDHAGESLVALASGINFGMGPFVGALSGYLSDVLGPRRIVMFAAVCHCLAFNLASLARSKIAFVIAYGPLMGAAFGCMVTPGSHATSSYFDKQRSIAMGVNYAGGGVGSALVPHIAALLLTQYGEEEWRPAMRWMSLLSLGCFIPALILTKREEGGATPTPLQQHLQRGLGEEEEADNTINARLSSQGGGGGIGGSSRRNNAAPSIVTDDEECRSEARTCTGDDTRTLGGESAILLSSSSSPVNESSPPPTVMAMVRTRRFVSLFFVAVFFGYAFYSSAFNWVPFAKAQGAYPYAGHAPMTLDDCTHVTIAFGVVQAASNVLLGVAASWLNPHYVYVGSTMVASAAMFAWPWCADRAQLLAVASFAGMGSAGARTIFPALIANHFPDRVGSMMGVTFLGYGVGGLIGPPITSAIIDASDGRYDVALSVVGASCLVSALIYVLAVPAPLHAVGEMVASGAPSEEKVEEPSVAVVA